MKLLAITLLDVAREQNQRIHHTIRALAEMADEVVVATKARPTGRGVDGFLADALSYEVAEWQEGNVRTLAIHPPLNYAHATAAGRLHAETLHHPGRLARGAASALSLLGTARDVVLVPSFLTAILTRTGGTFDVCLAQGPWEAAVGWLLRRLGRVRYLVYDDIDFVAGGQITRLRQAYVAWLERTLIRSADLAFSSGWLLGEYRRQTSGREVMVIPNGVDPERFTAARARRPHPPTLVYTGFLKHFAGVDLAIRALPEIRRALPGTRLLVVGDGDPSYVEGLRRLVASQGLEQAVEFRGALPYETLPEVFAESDIGVAAFQPIPVASFAFPLKVLDYLAAGLPVIGTSGSETAEILRRHACGRAVEFTPESLARAALDLLGDPAGLQRASEAARQVAGQLTWSSATEAQCGAVKGLLAGGMAGNKPARSGARRFQA